MVTNPRIREPSFTQKSDNSEVLSLRSVVSAKVGEITKQDNQGAMLERGARGQEERSIDEKT